MSAGNCRAQWSSRDRQRLSSTLLALVASVLSVPEVAHIFPQEIELVGSDCLLLSSPLLALVASVPSIPEAAHIFPQEIELVGYDSLLPPSPLLPLVASESGEIHR